MARALALLDVCTNASAAFTNTHGIPGRPKRTIRKFHRDSVAKRTIGNSYSKKPVDKSKNGLYHLISRKRNLSSIQSSSPIVYNTAFDHRVKHQKSSQCFRQLPYLHFINNLLSAIDNACFSAAVIRGASASAVVTKYLAPKEALISSSNLSNLFFAIFCFVGKRNRTNQLPSAAVRLDVRNDVSGAYGIAGRLCLKTKWLRQASTLPPSLVPRSKHPLLKLNLLSGPIQMHRGSTASRINSADFLRRPKMIVFTCSSRHLSHRPKRSSLVASIRRIGSFYIVEVSKLAWHFSPWIQSIWRKSKHVLRAVAQYER